MQEEQGATPWPGWQDGLSGMLNRSLGKLEGCGHYTQAAQVCELLPAAQKNAIYASVYKTQALCSKPQEGHVPPPSQIQFPIKVNTCKAAPAHWQSMMETGLRSKGAFSLPDEWGGFTVHGAPQADVREAHENNTGTTSTGTNSEGRYVHLTVATWNQRGIV